MPIYPGDLDIPPFQLRRSSASTVSNYVAAEGEPVWATDTKTLYVGDGTTTGGIPIAGEGFTATNVSTSTLINGTYTLSLEATGEVSFPYYTFPAVDGLSGQVLETDGAGTLSWTTATGGSSYDQNLNTTDNVVFNSVKTAKVTSAGGYPLDSNGEALIATSNTQTPAMVVSNYTNGIVPQLNIRGWGQNRPAGTSTTSATPSAMFEAARGTTSSPTTVGSGDVVMSLSGGGYDGTEWSSGRNLYPFQILALATEAYAGNATTTTNAGTRLFIRAQSSGTQLTSTSRQGFLQTTWTPGSTATSSPPQMNIFWGTAGGDSPTLIPSNGLGSFGTGHGATNIFGINTKQNIYGVPSQDSSPDNTTLTGTNYLTFATGRRSGVSGRRNAVLTSDTLGGIDFRGQTANNSSTSGGRGAQIYAVALENFGSTTRGSKLVLSTIKQGSTTEQTRLSLSDQNNDHYADQHTLHTADGVIALASFSTSSVSLIGDQVSIGDGTNAPRLYAYGGSTGLYVGGSGLSEVLFSTSQVQFTDGMSNTIASLTTSSSELYSDQTKIYDAHGTTITNFTTSSIELSIGGVVRLSSTIEGMHMAQKYWTIGQAPGLGGTEGVITTADTGQDLYLYTHNYDEAGGKVKIENGNTGGVIVYAGTGTEVANFNTSTITLTADILKLQLGTEIQGPTGNDLTISADGTANINLNADTVRIGDNNADATLTTHGTGDLIIAPHDGNVLINTANNHDVEINGKTVQQIATSRAIAVAIVFG